jgi:hypothetical protein
LLSKSGLEIKVRSPLSPPIANLLESNEVGSTPTGMIEYAGVVPVATTVRASPIAFSAKFALVDEVKTGASALAFELEKIARPITKEVVKENFRMFLIVRLFLFNDSLHV